MPSSSSCPCSCAHMMHSFCSKKLPAGSRTTEHPCCMRSPWISCPAFKPPSAPGIREEGSQPLQLSQAGLCSFAAWGLCVPLCEGAGRGVEHLTCWLRLQQLFLPNPSRIIVKSACVKREWPKPIFGASLLLCAFLLSLVRNYADVVLPKSTVCEENICSLYICCPSFVFRKI